MTERLSAERIAEIEHLMADWTMVESQLFKSTCSPPSGGTNTQAFRDLLAEREALLAVLELEHGLALKDFEHSQEVCRDLLQRLALAEKVAEFALGNGAHAIVDADRHRGRLWCKCGKMFSYNSFPNEKPWSDHAKHVREMAAKALEANQ